MPAYNRQARQPKTPLPAALWLMPLGGVALSLAFPNEILPGAAGDRPFFLVGWLALIPLLWATQAWRGRARYLAAYWYGAGFAVATLSWARLFGYIPWLGLSFAYFAIFFPLALWLARRMPAQRLLPCWFALAYTGLEWLRGQGLFGFAWSELGFSQIEGFPARLAAVGGAPIITLLMLCIVGAAVQTTRDRRPESRRLLATSLAALAVLGGLGYWQTRQTVARWEGAPARQQIAVVQPSVLRGLTPAALRTTLTAEELDRRLSACLALSRQGVASMHADAGPRLVIWPESALSDPPYQQEDIFRFCRDTGSHLLVGAPAFSSDEHRWRQLNAAYLIGSDVRVPFERYAKMHLVPFGEFVPMRPLVQRFYTVRAEDMLPGDARRPLRGAGPPIGVGICFESTFTGIARQYADQGARLLVFITNDAWFHHTAAVRQHFNQARFRALETGLPVARAASTGISGFIAPDGRILGELPIDAADALVRTMPAGTPGTLYTRGGWLVGPICLLLALALAAYGMLQRRLLRGVL